MHEIVIIEAEPQCKCGANIDRVKTEVRLLSENQMICTIYCGACGHIFSIADASGDLSRLRENLKFKNPTCQEYYDKLMQEYKERKANEDNMQISVWR